MAVLSLLAIPFFAHAGLFSAIAGIFSEDRPQGTVATTQNAQTMSLLRAAVHVDPNPSKGGGDVLIADGALVPETSPSGVPGATKIQESNGEISLYIVREGDSLSQIADMFDVTMNTIMWANNLPRASAIQPGDTLVILPISGIRHTVKEGDTLASLAKKYGGDADEIMSYNQLASATLRAGDVVVIPGGEIETPKPAVSSSVAVSTGGSAAAAIGFIHPLPGSIRTQGIHGYNGVDLAAAVGTAIRAAAAGDVIIAASSGWNGGYGNYVVVRHANGTQTLYAHMSSVAVSTGDSVSQGETLGGVGNTGRSTGPHLHFEVRGAKNPF